MSHFPNLGWQQLEKLAQRKGYQLDHQTGSHLIYRLPNGPPQPGLPDEVTIPKKNDLGIGLRRSIAGKMGYSRDDVEELLRRKEI